MGFTYALTDRRIGKYLQYIYTCIWNCRCMHTGSQRLDACLRLVGAKESCDANAFTQGRNAICERDGSPLDILDMT